MTLGLLGLVVFCAAAAGCHEHLTWKERFRGVSSGKIVADLDSDQPDVVRKALVYLSYVKYKDNEHGKNSQQWVMEQYSAYLEGDSPNPRIESDVLIRSTAAECMSRCGDYLTDGALKALLKALKEDPDEMVRADCATALGKLLRNGTAPPPGEGPAYRPLGEGPNVGGPGPGPGDR